MLGIVRIRGRMNLKKEVEDTMQMLGLKKKFWFTTIDPESKPLKGMLNKVKDYVTYGEVDEALVKKILGDKKSKGLNPPKKGFKYSSRRSGAKGELGKREDMKAFLERMI